LTGKTNICEVQDGTFTHYSITPEQFSLERCSQEDLTGGDAEENAGITRSILSGTLHGPKRDIVLLNSGCALYIAGKASSIAEGIDMAREAIDSGKALQQLDAFVKLSNEE
jgi:anthranilate phosphoribosyltransferase